MLPEAAGEHDGSLLVLTQAEKSLWASEQLWGQRRS